VVSFTSKLPPLRKQSGSVRHRRLTDTARPNVRMISSSLVCGHNCTPERRWSVFYLLLASTLAITPGSFTPQELLQQGVCRDTVSDQTGHCFLFNHEGEVYMVFTQDGTPIFIRQIRSDRSGYDEVWRSDTPLGVSL